MTLIAGKPSLETFSYLEARRSVSVKNLAAPGPDKAALDKILKTAARVPDHGRTVPFYFVTFEGAARVRAGEKIAEIFKRDNPDASADKIEAEANRFARAPLVVGVIYRARRGKHPLWEQMLSAGAVCQNLLLAANASGFGANWLTEWYAYNNEFKDYLGLDGRDIVAGFIHIGSVTEIPEERERPDMSAITTSWTPGIALNKGDADGGGKFDFPRLGFDPEILQG